MSSPRGGMSTPKKKNIVNMMPHYEPYGVGAVYILFDLFSVTIYVAFDTSSIPASLLSIK